MSSFFGFDPSVPQARPHNASAHGFGQVPDAFAGLSARDYQEDEGEALDFEDTYDGLGDQLDEADDALNNDTFGGGPVDRNFEFAGQSAAIAGLPKTQQPSQPTTRQLPSPHFQEQQYQAQFYPSQQYQPQTMQQSRGQPIQLFPNQPAPKPARTGYERYKEPDSIPKLEASASIWGQPAQRPSSSVQPQTSQSRQATPQQNIQQHSGQVPSLTTVSKKMMSLEEVEAMMRTQSAKPSPAPAQQTSYPPPQQPQQEVSHAPPDYHHQPRETSRSPMPLPQINQLQGLRSPSTGGMQQPPQILQRPHSGMAPPPIIPQVLGHSPQPQAAQQQQQQQQQHQQQQQRLPPQPIPAPRQPQIATLHARVPSHGPSVVQNARQMLQMSEQERTHYLEEDAKRAKRNHKIHLLSKDNGLMTPQDKNFITRIQLQQLLTATGGLEEQGPEAALAEDFYYQIYSQIRGPQINPNQQLSQFAQTYIHQTAGRTGNRRYARGGDQIRRMEQQVQRAVEAAKLKPKNKQLVIEGSLGKISFANVKTPKPLLSLRRQDAQDRKPRAPETLAGRKATLRAIESVYSAVLRMEEHERRMPRQTTEESSADEIQEQIDWRARIQHLNAELWSELKVMEPIDPSATTPHPFIAILSHPKGKKVLPRVFRQIDDQQRLTILTMIAIHLDSLDVVRLAYSATDAPLAPAVRDAVELFSQTVMHCLFGYISDAPLGVLVGLLGLILERVNVQFIARTKIGLAMLTIFLSRAELIKDTGHAEAQDIEEFGGIYNGLFDQLEPSLPTIFTTPINAGEDVYVWQFLAAVGSGASPEQQERLVLGVKDRVMDSVAEAKLLPDEVGKPRLDNVNLFMKAIGLDVELLG